MAKTICDWSKRDLAERPEKLLRLTQNACFYCKKCGRVANTTKALCKAESFRAVTSLSLIHISEPTRPY